MTLISIIHFPFLYFLFMNSSVGLDYNNELTFSKNSVKLQWAAMGHYSLF
jgi:hypothetical protein